MDGGGSVDRPSPLTRAFPAGCARDAIDRLCLRTSPVRCRYRREDLPNRALALSELHQTPCVPRREGGSASLQIRPAPGAGEW